MTTRLSINRSFMVLTVTILAAIVQSQHVEGASGEAEGLNIANNSAKILPGYKAEKKGNKFLIFKEGSRTATAEITCSCGPNRMGCGLRYKGKVVTCKVPLQPICSGEPCLMEVKKP
jgi:hypothetical protein